VNKIFLQRASKLGPLLLLVSLEFFLVFCGLGDLPFYMRGEPREGLVVWEMYKSGNWILPAIQR